MSLAARKLRCAEARETVAQGTAQVPLTDTNPWGMLENWIWGAVPPAFKKLSPGPKRLMLIVKELEPFLPQKVWIAPGELRNESPFQGRDRIWYFHLDSGEKGLIRPYRHGGLLRALSGALFFTWPPRPFKEVAVTEEVKRRGIPTLEIMGACVERTWGPFYRGWLLTRELGGAQDLWAVLQAGSFSIEERSYVLRSVARSISSMHQKGVYHADLNLRNILIRKEASAVKAYIIDFDKARLFPGRVPRRRAERNLRRLLRSVRKLDPGRRYLAAKDWELFERFYSEAGDDASSG